MLLCCCCLQSRRRVDCEGSEPLIKSTLSNETDRISIPTSGEQCIGDESNLFVYITSDTKRNIITFLHPKDIFSLSYANTCFRYLVNEHMFTTCKLQLESPINRARGTKLNGNYSLNLSRLSSQMSDADHFNDVWAKIMPSRELLQGLRLAYNMPDLTFEEGLNMIKTRFISNTFTTMTVMNDGRIDESNEGFLVYDGLGIEHFPAAALKVQFKASTLTSVVYQIRDFSSEPENEGNRLCFSLLKDWMILLGSSDKVGVMVSHGIVCQNTVEIFFWAEVDHLVFTNEQTAEVISLVCNECTFT